MEFNGKVLKNFSYNELNNIGINNIDDQKVILKEIENIIIKCERINELRNNINNIDFNKFCLLCHTNIKDHFIGCGHKFCLYCINNLKQKMINNKCPICFKKILITIKVRE